MNFYPKFVFIMLIRHIWVFQINNFVSIKFLKYKR